MKKTIAIIVFACLIFGCSADGDDRLVGSSWYTQDINYEEEHGGICNEIYEFVSPHTLKCFTTQNGVVAASYGTYTYELIYPKIKIVTDLGEVRRYTFVDSRTLILDGVDENDYYAKYYLER